MSDTPRVVMLSLWRNDAERNLEWRARHLLDKSYPNLRYVWVVGDSADMTGDILTAVADTRVQLITIQTGIHDRYRRLSQSANAGLDCVAPSDDIVFIHESDLISPPDVVERMLAHGKMPIAGWPTLTIPEGDKVFYDILAYHRDGERFISIPPYHTCYRSDELFEVDGVGSCWMFHATDARAGVRMGKGCAIELCKRLKWRGRHIWVDPTLEIIQPTELWTHQSVGAGPKIDEGWK